ncbi:MAG: DUF4912 domain-containing protein [Treponema sp.]|nr:DUF4912 domain-containing protein [Treponema sp.]MBR4631619.1 DUF4912 domain-containing protein [Treponema sp.]
MDTKILSRSYLETLSSSDLIALADDYGIDIPDNLSRRFIIGELLELSEELNGENANPDSAISELSDLSDEEASALPESLKSGLNENLPETFNETEIDFVFRNPVWAYVFWDIKAADLKKMKADEDFDGVVLRVSYFNSKEATAPVYGFDVNVSLEEHGRFVMLAVNKPTEHESRYLRIDLVAVYGEKSESIALSRKEILPVGSCLLGNAKPGRDIELSPVAELSGMRAALRRHYEFHRESFV